MIIYFEPRGGLCNRMRALHSVYYLAEKLSAKLVILWDENGEFCCQYDEVFERIKKVRYKKLYSKKIAGVSSFCKRLYTLLIRQFLRLYCGKCIYEEDTFDYSQYDNTEDILKEFDKKKIYMRSEFDFYESDYLKHDMSFLKFKRDIFDKVERVFCWKGQEIIGVHVRRTDHVDSIQNSILDVFFDKIDYCISKNENLKIYLATDDMVTQQEMIARYGERILFFKGKEFRRSEKQGVIDACVELLCLSRTSCIYGSFLSSYSKMAADLGRIPLYVIKK